jgi:hypothetical protein
MPTAATPPAGFRTGLDDEMPMASRLFLWCRRAANPHRVLVRHLDILVNHPRLAIAHAALQLQPQPEVCQ